MKKLTFGIRSKLPKGQAGFIPMMLAIIGVILLVIFLIYSRVAHVNH